MARPLIGTAPQTPAERQRRRRERLAAKKEAEQTRRNAALKADEIARAKAVETMRIELCSLRSVVEQLTSRNAELERLKDELAKRDAERSNETPANRDVADSHETKEALTCTAPAQQQHQPKKPKKPTAPYREDLLKVCGVQFWPQTDDLSRADYAVVWAAAHIVDSVYREFHLTCKMPIADAIMSTKQLCRALRLFNKEGGQLILAMLTAMANHKELIGDHTATSWPTLSGKPPAFDA